MARIIALAVALAALLGVRVDADAASALVVPLSTSIHGASFEYETQIAEAVQRFADAGLRLPPLHIYVHRSQDGCHGYLGYYGDGQRVDICMWAEQIILHELAHAWERHHVADETRAAFIEHTDSTTWDDLDTPRERRGIEVAAETIAFGLSSKPLSDTAAITNRARLEGYELLTGNPSPRLRIPLAELLETIAVSVDPAIVEGYATMTDARG